MFDDTTSSSRRSFLRNRLLASGLAVGLSAGVGVGGETTRYNFEGRGASSQQ